MADYINKASIQLRELIKEALGKTVADGTFPAVPIPDFNIEIPAIMGVMSALVLAFVLGIGLSKIKNSAISFLSE